MIPTSFLAIRTFVLDELKPYALPVEDTIKSHTDGAILPYEEMHVMTHSKGCIPPELFDKIKSKFTGWWQISFSGVPNTTNRTLQITILKMDPRLSNIFLRLTEHFRQIDLSNHLYPFIIPDADSDHIRFRIHNLLQGTEPNTVHEAMKSFFPCPFTDLKVSQSISKAAITKSAPSQTDRRVSFDIAVRIAPQDETELRDCLKNLFDRYISASKSYTNNSLGYWSSAIC